MVAFEFAGGLGHGGFVERAGIVERALVFEWRQHLAAPDAVAVGFALGLPASVEIGADFFGGDDADCGRKQGVQGALEFGGGDGGLRFEMGDLAEGVNAGVVRLAPWMKIFSWVIWLAASAMAPWMVGWPGWICQPWKVAPS